MTLISNDFIWFKLFSTPNIGAKSIFEIYDFLKYENINLYDFYYRKAKGFIPNYSKNGIEEFLTEPNENDVNIFQEIHNSKIYIIHPECTYFPLCKLSIARKLGITPVFLAKGSIGLLNSNGYAIVGSRKVSDKGKSITQKISRELAILGYNVISGGAKGVDHISHISALNAEGTTTVVIPEGLLQYRLPSDISSKLLNNNCLIVSQFRAKEKWSSGNAMRRNKLLIALSNGIFVVETGPRISSDGKQSGTYNTAINALENNVPLFVFGSSVFQSDMPNNEDLIKQGGIEIKKGDILKQLLNVHTDENRDSKNISLTPKQLSFDTL